MAIGFDILPWFKQRKVQRTSKVYSTLINKYCYELLEQQSPNSSSFARKKHVDPFFIRGYNVATR